MNIPSSPLSSKIAISDEASEALKKGQTDKKFTIDKETNKIFVSTDALSNWWATKLVRWGFRLEAKIECLSPNENPTSTTPERPPESLFKVTVDKTNKLFSLRFKPTSITSSSDPVNSSKDTKPKHVKSVSTTDSDEEMKEVESFFSNQLGKFKEIIGRNQTLFSNSPETNLDSLYKEMISEINSKKTVEEKLEAFKKHFCTISNNVGTARCKYTSNKNYNSLYTDKYFAKLKHFHYDLLRLFNQTIDGTHQTKPSNCFTEKEIQRFDRVRDLLKNDPYDLLEFNFLIELTKFSQNPNFYPEDTMYGLKSDLEKKVKSYETNDYLVEKQ